MDKAVRNTTHSKVEAIKSFITTWLKDQRVYCNNCGEQWNKDIHLYESCCENPQFGKNIDHCYGLLKQNKETKLSRLKTTGATDNNNIRFAVSLPPRLYADLETFFAQYDEKLFNNKNDLRKFMKEFPEFCSCQTV